MNLALASRVSRTLTGLDCLLFSFLLVSQLDVQAAQQRLLNGAQQIGRLVYLFLCIPPCHYSTAAAVPVMYHMDAPGLLTSISPIFWQLKERSTDRLQGVIWTVRLLT